MDADNRRPEDVAGNFKTSTFQVAKLQPNDRLVCARKPDRMAIWEQLKCKWRILDSYPDPTHSPLITIFMTLDEFQEQRTVAPKDSVAQLRLYADYLEKNPGRSIVIVAMTVEDGTGGGPCCIHHGVNGFTEGKDDDVCRGMYGFTLEFIEEFINSQS